MVILPQRATLMAQRQNKPKLPVDLNGKMYKNLPERLRTQSRNVLMDGWANAHRLMHNAADTIEYLIDNGIILVDDKDD